MSYIQSKLAHLNLWLDEQTTRDDEKLKQRPVWWHVGKILIGAGCMARSVKLVVEGGSTGSYVLASVFLFGGAFFVYEGFAMLKTRQDAPKVLSR